jgi:hypothetical protein
MIFPIRVSATVDHPTICSAEVKERVEIYFYSPSGFVACSKVNFTFTFIQQFNTLYNGK